MNGKKNGLRLILLLLLVAAPALFFGRALHLDFVTWDDDINVTENPRLNPVTLRGVLDYWLHPLKYELYPLSNTLWGLEAVLCQKVLRPGLVPALDSRVFHATNVLLHVVATIAVFAILRPWVGKPWPAACGALLFSLHPIQVEPVAWVTGGKDVLCGTFSLIALGQYLAWARASRSDDAAPFSGTRPAAPPPGASRRPYVFAFTSFVLALAAKPTAVSLPLVAWVLAMGIAGRTARQGARSLLPWFALSLLSAIATKSTQPDAFAEYVPSIWLRPFVAADAIAFYLTKLVWPFRFCADYGRSPRLVIEKGWAYLTWLVPAAVLFVAATRRERRPWITSAAVSAAALAPVLGIIPFSYQRFSTVADRYLYVAMLGPAMALAWLLSSRNPGKPGRAISVAILALLGIRTALQIPVWKDGPALWAHALAVNPRSYAAHYNLAKSLDGLGDFRGATAHYERALEIKPDYARARNGLGLVLAAQGRLAGAAAEYRKGIETDPRDFGLRNNLGLVLDRLGDPEGAIVQYSEALKTEPDFAEAHYHLGNSLAGIGRRAEAFVHYAEAARLKPALAPDVHNNWGLALSSEGKLEEAATQYDEALRIRPDFPQARNNLGIVLAAEGRLREAAAQYSRALRADPGMAEAHNNLGIALARLGELDRAREQFQEALRIRPDYEPARRNLDIALGAAAPGPGRELGPAP